ncbi:HEPN domain-containing protein [Leptolyngbya cf. ectocarpi LEGE 11479]|uniref:HEPN domain-containing protein n=1 Tax=Leptolyngbya cf. ectocarpi LEGE 11479 TaxID=1828722 RepID=A0A928ZTV4_LEPEC|nr:HEPN domain-containing protein [Leptolyngbya ectocarpi]MBE9067352.1 HEPN domain-containing protein [Leptolyngbya cf. ectocarpi LEGE 11479]
MNDLSEARSLLNAANRDLRAMSGMTDSQVFADEIFGFHGQQTAEKALKAWISALGEVFPFTHDVAALLRIIEAKGYDVSSFWELAAFNDFAVRLRYAELENDVEPLDREQSIAMAQAIYQHVDNFISGQVSS